MHEFRAFLLRWRPALRVLAALAALARPTPSAAEEVPVPIPLQAELLFMIAAHDHNLAARAGGQVHTLVLNAQGERSGRAATQFKVSATAKTSVAGLPHVVEEATYAGPGALAEACRSKKLSIVYLAPGFSAVEAAAIGQALTGANVLTVSAAPELVRKGVVLGFDLVAGRPKLVVDLAQAAKQKVSFGPDVLGLMAVAQ